MTETPGSITPRSIPEHLAVFARHLRTAGIPVSPAEVIACCHALELVDIARRDDVRAAACSTLVRDCEHLRLFDEQFDAYWVHPHVAPPANTARPEQRQHAPEQRIEQDEGTRTLLLDTGAEDAGAERDSALDDPESIAASPVDVIAHRDLGSLDEREQQLARTQIRLLLRSLANRPGHRHRRHRRHGDVDLRLSLRQALRHGLDALEIVYRKRRIRRLRVLLLCDISGSMARYSAFFLSFIHALRDELPGLEAAVFATRLTPVTELLRHGDPAASIAGLQKTLRGWGGGTDIGRALDEFNQRFAQQMLHSRTVVVILSDGWDCGDASGMRNAMATLRHWTDTLVWLNPLLGDADYQPLCRGMQTALPFIDHLLPAHSLASLADAAALLRDS